MITLSLARKTGASVLLRIDDLDKERATPAFLQDIFDTLHFLELPWDEGPKDATDFALHYSQHLRLSLYEEALQQLARLPQVFACNCSRQQILHAGADDGYPGTCRNKDLSLQQPRVAWRVQTPDATSGMQTGTCKIAPGPFPPSVRHFVVRKKDGMPAYQLASVIDDLHFGVDLVVRGADLCDSTEAQLYLAGLLGAQSFAETTFLHHPLLVDAQGAKLSKSAGAGSVYQLRTGGKSKAEVFQTLVGLCGIREPVHDWQSAATVLEMHLLYLNRYEWLL